MNFMGFLRLYRITGDKSLFRKVAGAWDDIHKRQMYITGGVSVAEHYEHDYVKPISGHVVETCATMSWMQLTQMLLELTGESKYADAMERLMINHVLPRKIVKPVHAVIIPHRTVQNLMAIFMVPTVARQADIASFPCCPLSCMRKKEKNFM